MIPYKLAAMAAGEAAAGATGASARVLWHLVAPCCCARAPAARLCLITSVVNWFGNLNPYRVSTDHTSHSHMPNKKKQQNKKKGQKARVSSPQRGCRAFCWIFCPEIRFCQSFCSRARTGEVPKRKAVKEMAFARGNSIRLSVHKWFSGWRPDVITANGIFTLEEGEKGGLFIRWL
jgi:hypothetical protein